MCFDGHRVNVDLEKHEGRTCRICGKRPIRGYRHLASPLRLRHRLGLEQVPSVEGPLVKLEKSGRGWSCQGNIGRSGRPDVNR